MPSRLKRYYTSRDLYFITCSCYRRRPLLGSAWRRDLFLEVLEQTRQRHQFVVVGYVVMPEHFHLLMSEPKRGDPSVVMKVVKQRFARMVSNREGATPIDLCAKRDGDHVAETVLRLNVWTEHKHIEKLRYIHRDPVKRGLVELPEEWAWSSFRACAYAERGVVRVNFQEWELRVKARKPETFEEASAPPDPTQSQSTRLNGAPKPIFQQESTSRFP